MHKYPSDISLEQFKKIKPILEKSRKKTCPKTVDLYEVFCGILYLLKSGCQWRMLPKEYPKWQTCYYYFKCWTEVNFQTKKSPLEAVLKKNGLNKSNFRRKI